MRQFDSLLRSGLMDANLAQYRGALQRAESGDVDFSPGYRRERMRLLADPWGWEKRRRTESAGSRGRRRRLARNIACLLLACTVALGALLAASPTVRAAVENWLRQIIRGGEQVEVRYYPGDPEETALRTSWRPAWLPEGWVLRDLRYSDETGTRWEFVLSGCEENARPQFTFGWKSEGGLSYGTNDGSWDFRIQTTVQGRPADYYEGDRSCMLVWEAEDGSLLSLDAHYWVDRATLERIAESTEPWTGEPAEYTVGWVPEGHVERPASATAREGNLRWVEHFASLSFQYVNGPFCPFETPERPWEEVSVNGLPGRYWPSLVPMEEKGAGVSGDPAYSPAITYAVEESAVLAWEDPEMGARFRIAGILEREDLLRMAESVTKKTPEDRAEP